MKRKYSLNIQVPTILLFLYSIVAVINVYTLSAFQQFTFLSKTRTFVLILMAVIAFFFQKHTLKQLIVFILGSIITMKQDNVLVLLRMQMICLSDNMSTAKHWKN